MTQRFAPALILLTVFLLLAPLSINAQWWRPALKTTWHIQYTGTLNTSVPATAYDIDLFDTSQSTINALKAKGKKIICYFSAGSYEDWRPDASQFPSAVLGKNMDDWPGEKWLDISKISLLAPIMGARLDLAKQKGCDAVDPDNVDGYQNDNGKGLTATQQLAYNKWIATEAHNRNLSVGLKNDLDQVSALVSHYDFAVNEQCFQYKECDALNPFINAGKPVFNIEYSLSPSSFCSKAVNKKFSSLKKKLSLNGYYIDCFDYMKTQK